MILIGVFSVTAFVLIANVAVVSPLGIVTVSGNFASPESEDRFTFTPSFGAAPLSFSVPVDAVPPRTLVDDRANVVSNGGVRVRIAGTLSPTVYAEIVASSLDPTATVVNENDVAVEPAGTTTVSGPPQADVVEGK